MLGAFSGIFIISIIASAVSVALQYKIGSKQEIKKMQQRMKEKQKKLLELSKKGGKNKKEMDKLQAELASIMAMMMKLNSRFLIITMPLFLIVFVVVKIIYGSSTITLPFGIKLLAIELTNFRIFLSNKLGWIEWYIYAGIISSIIINAIANRIMESKNSGAEKDAKTK